MSPAKPKEITIELTREQAKVHSQRFVETGEKSAHTLGTLYVKKDADAKLGSPEGIRITITAI